MHLLQQSGVTIMRINVVMSLLKKEFLNIIRDKKSFIFMILLPLLMFPLMIGIITVMMNAMTSVQDSVIKFGVNYEITDDFKEFVSNYSEDYKYEIIYDTEENLKEKFDNKELSIYVIKENNTYNMHFDENSTSDLASSMEIESLYNDYKEVYIENMLATQGIDYNELKNSFLIKQVQENVTEMGSLVPMILSMVLTMLITSTVFNVAVEITTSEKEKGTLETLLSLPIKKSELITSKYITTIIMGIITGILTYISLFTTLYLGKSTLNSFGITSLNINPKILIIYLIAIILFSIFLSGVILSLAIFSKSLKEAQNTLAPIETGMILISYLPMLGIEASTKNAIIPFANIALLFNNALSSNLDTMFIILTFLSTIAYSMILILIVSKLYNEEDILFNSSNLKNISFTSGKSKTIRFTTFTSLIIMIIAFLLPLYFGLIFITKSKYVQLAITPVTILLIIIIAGLINKLDFKKAFKFSKFNFKQFLYLLLMLIGTRIIVDYILEVIVTLFPSTLSTTEVLNDALSLDNIWISLLLLAVLPPVAEELLFRGVTLNSFMHKYTPWIGIIISSVLFGVFHMNLLQGINACILGIVLGYSYYKTKSIFVPIILHSLNNAYAVVLDFCPSLSLDIPLMDSILLVILAVTLVASSFYFIEKELRK